MGTDAILYANNGKKHYYDRENNLSGYSFDCDNIIYKMWWEGLRKNGLTKYEIMDYFKFLLLSNNDTFEINEEIIFECIKFVINLPDGVLIRSINENDNEYYDNVNFNIECVKNKKEV